jgi:hypothetical protein
MGTLCYYAWQPWRGTTPAERVMGKQLKLKSLEDSPKPTDNMWKRQDLNSDPLLSRFFTMVEGKPMGRQ